MVETGIEARDYTWLVRALDQLKVARGVLSNSYAFAYFFFGGGFCEGWRAPVLEARAFRPVQAIRENSVLTPTCRAACALCNRRDVQGRLQ